MATEEEARALHRAERFRQLKDTQAFTEFLAALGELLEANYTRMVGANEDRTLYQCQGAAKALESVMRLADVQIEGAQAIAAGARARAEETARQAQATAARAASRRTRGNYASSLP